MHSRIRAMVVMLLLIVVLPLSLFAGAAQQAAESQELELVWMMPSRPEAPVRPEAPSVDEIARLTGIRIKMEGVPSSDWAQVWQVLLATDDLSDLMMTGFPGARDFFDTGNILPLSDYYDQMPNLTARVAEVPDVRKFYLDGKLYHLPKIWRDFPIYGQFPLIRMDIVEELGLSVPDTFEELYDVLKAMKEAYPSTYPYAARGLGSLMGGPSYALGVPYGMDWDPEVDGGSWVYGTSHEGFYPVLEWLNRLYSEGILDPDYASVGGPQWQERLGSGKSFFFFDNSSFAENMNAVIMRTEGVANAYQLLSTLENYDGVRRNRIYHRHHLNNGTIISANVAEPERVVQFADWLYSDEGSRVTNLGRESIDYTIVNGEVVVAPEHVAARASDSDPWRSHESYMGVGHILLGHWVDTRTDRAWRSEFGAQMFAQIGEDPYLDERSWAPPFTADETRRIAQLRGQLDTLNEEYVIRFINGERPLTRASFNAFREELVKAGARDLERMYNVAEARVGR